MSGEGQDPFYWMVNDLWRKAERGAMRKIILFILVN